MFAARASSAASVRAVRSGTSFSVAAGRAAPRAFSAKPPDKPVPTPEEEAERQAVQMRALDTVLKDKNAGEGSGRGFCRDALPGTMAWFTLSINLSWRRVACWLFRVYKMTYPISASVLHHGVAYVIVYVLYCTVCLSIPA